MPRSVHRRLEREADRLGLSGGRRRAYVFGTLARLEKRRKGKR